MKIAIVGAKDSVDKVYKIGINCYKEYEFIPYIAGVSDYCSTILNECEEISDGIIFTGLGFVNVTKNFKKLSKPYEFISRDGSCIMKAFWDIMNMRLKPEKISIDIVNRYLVEDICEEFDCFFKELYTFPYHSDIKETQVIEQHKHLWKTGKIDTVITSYGWIYNELKREGVPVVRLEITAPIIRNSIDKLICKIENHNIKRSQIAVQIVDVDVKQDCNRYEYEALRKRNFIESMIIDYLPIIQGTVSQNRENQYRIISTRGAIENNIAEEAFLKILKVTKKENIKLYGGVGFGHTAFDADFNARIALNKSKEAKVSSYFIVDDKKRITGPIGSEESLHYESLVTSDLVNKVAEETGLSSTYISKINYLTKNIDSEYIDSKKLAELLFITDRSARRILKKLFDSGYANLVTSSQTNSVGRPTKVYKINISK